MYRNNMQQQFDDNRSCCSSNDTTIIEQDDYFNDEKPINFAKNKASRDSDTSCDGTSGINTNSEDSNSNDDDSNNNKDNNSDRSENNDNLNSSEQSKANDNEEQELEEEEDDSNASKQKRVRTIFTPEQLAVLEHEFSQQIYLVGEGRVLLAKMLNLTEDQVKVWFQNRRIKYRKLNLGLKGC